MSPQAFSTALLLGAAAIALWFVHRTAGHAPRRVWAVLLHVFAANVLSSALLTVAVAAIPTLGPVSAVMLIAFPPLVYFFVACAWLVLMLQRLLSPAR
jgi:hypothetical protein